ncbi:hypothetical protein OROGR_028266 [Orobanche gracilis]
MVTQYPYFLGMRVGTMIKPLVDYLVSLGLPKKILARMFEKRTYILGYDLEETWDECLMSFGIKTEAIASVIAQYPQVLGLPLKAKLSSQEYFFSLKLKIDPDGFGRVVEKMPQIVSLKQNVIMKPVDFLLGHGILADDVANGQFGRCAFRSQKNSPTAIYILFSFEFLNLREPESRFRPQKNSSTAIYILFPVEFLDLGEAESRSASY